MTEVVARVCEQRGWRYDGETVTVPLAEGRSQELFVATPHEEGEHLLRLHTVIGSAGKPDLARLESALRINARLRHGAIAILEGDLILVDTFHLPGGPAHGLDAEQVGASMEYLAGKADAYGQDLPRGDRY